MERVKNHEIAFHHSILLYLLEHFAQGVFRFLSLKLVQC